MSTGAFDLLDRPLLFIPVTWPGLAATEDGGAKRIEHTVEIQIEILDRDEFAKFIVRADSEVGVGEADLEKRAAMRAAHELETFKLVAKGWRRVKAGSRDVQFNDENAAKLLLFPGFVDAFGEAYMDAWRGQIATREGNSAGSSVAGAADEPTDATRKGASK